MNIDILSFTDKNLPQEKDEIIYGETKSDLKLQNTWMKDMEERMKKLESHKHHEKHHHHHDKHHDQE